MNQQYLLENDVAALNIVELKEFWTSSIKANNGQRARFGIVSKVLENIQVFAYDHPELVKKYPYGFHTENTILFNKSVIDSVLELRAPQFDSYTLINPVTHQKLIVSAVLDLLEDTYHVAFGDSERVQLMNSLIVQGVQANDNPRLESVTTAELESIARASGVSAENSQYQKKLGTDIQAINTVLFDSPEVHNPASPFNKLAPKVIELQAESMPVDLNPDLATFKENYVNRSYSFSSNYTNKVMRHLLSEAIRNNNEPLTGQKLVENLSGKWMVFLGQLNPPEFARSIEMIKEEIIKNYPDSNDNLVYDEKTREKLAILISEQSFMNIQTRKILIYSITGLSSVLRYPELSHRESNRPQKN